MNEKDVSEFMDKMEKLYSDDFILSIHIHQKKKILFSANTNTMSEFKTSFYDFIIIYKKLNKMFFYLKLKAKK